MCNGIEKLYIEPASACNLNCKMCFRHSWINEKFGFMSEKTLISAHRGGANLNPENTKKAFDYVIKDTTYTDIVEIDVRTTKEGELVIIHDDSVNRTGINGKVDPVKINDLTYEELTNYNLGVNFESPAKVFPYREYTIEEAKEAGLTIMLLKDFLKRLKSLS